MQLHSSLDDAPNRYVIEVKRRADLTAKAAQYAPKFEAGRVAAKNIGAAFRIMTEDRIRTPYLANARLLLRHLCADPELAAFDLIRQKLGMQGIAVGEAIALLRGLGMEEPDIRAGIEQAVAWRMLLCELDRPFDDSTVVRARAPGEISTRDSDPVMVSLRDADSE